MAYQPNDLTLAFDPHYNKNTSKDISNLLAVVQLNNNQLSPLVSSTLTPDATFAPAKGQNLWVPGYPIEVINTKHPLQSPIYDTVTQATGVWGARSELPLLEDADGGIGSPVLALEPTGQLRMIGLVTGVNPDANTVGVTGMTNLAAVLQTLAP